MSVRTRIVLGVSVFNSLWLAHVFAVLYLQGYYLITEPVPWIAFGELILCLAVAGLGIERLVNLRESRRRKRRQMRIVDPLQRKTPLLGKVRGR